MKRESIWRFLKPRYWPVWLGMGIVRLLIALPFHIQTIVGRGLGRLAWRFARREKHVGAINLRLCLPELTDRDRRRLLLRHFEALGCGLFDTALGWWAGPKRILKLTRIEGLDHLQTALGKERGVLLVSAHFTATEMGARALGVRLPAAAMYQRLGNAVAELAFLTSRGARELRMIPSDTVREILKALKANLPVWFAPDQREQMRSSAILPFFGIPAVTNIATSRLAQMSGAAVLPLFAERTAEGYLIRIGAPIEQLPSGDAEADALRFHALLEAQVRRCPAQYLWTYKRFKRPGPDGDPYTLHSTPGKQ